MTNNIANSDSRGNLGEASAAIWDVRSELKKRRRDRTGDIIEAPVTHDEARPPLPKPAPALFPEYCDFLEREAHAARSLTLAELEARHDAAEAELTRRRRA